MTENKRFTLGYVCGDFGLIDNDEWIDLHSMSENSEKNVQICINKMNKLAEENKELKIRNNRQAKQLDDLYRLIEEKDWRALTDILDDFKKADEQLQKEGKCYE